LNPFQEEAARVLPSELVWLLDCFQKARDTDLQLLRQR